MLTDSPRATARAAAASLVTGPRMERMTRRPRKPIRSTTRTPRSGVAIITDEASLKACWPG
jgi:hypothetical protein